jgi:arylsulfatase A-like enzyme
VPGYSTDQIADYVSGYIDEAARSSSPFFAVAGPVAPHIAAGATYPGNRTKLPYPVPKKEYEDLYQDLELPKGLNFNPTNRSGVNAVWELERLGAGNLWFFEEFYKRRQRALKSVDDLIGTLVQKLNDTGVLDNTYIIYSSDNGYHIGNHRLQGGKLQCFEEDINIPLLIRGPDVGKNMTADLVTGHIDIAPTILQLAGVEFDPAWELDGTAISFPFENQLDYIRNLQARGDSTHLEFWGPVGL